MSCLGNLIWILLGGVWTALYLFIAGVLLSITIIGIPLGAQCFKAAKLTLDSFFFPHIGRIALFGYQPDFAAGFGVSVCSVPGAAWRGGLSGGNCPASGSSGGNPGHSAHVGRGGRPHRGGFCRHGWRYVAKERAGARSAMPIGMRCSAAFLTDSAVAARFFCTFAHSPLPETGEGALRRPCRAAGRPREACGAGTRIVPEGGPNTDSYG